MAKRLINFSPAALTDPVPVIAKKKKNVSNCCYILGGGWTFFHVFRVLKYPLY